MALRTVGVRLQAEVAGYMAGIRQAKSATSDFRAELDKAAKGGNLDATADMAGRLGLGLVGVAGAAVAMAARFDAAMSSVQAATHASGEELEQLREAALKAGKDTAYSATEAAQAIEELAKAGVATTDILNGGLAGALDLAAAGQMEVADAAEVAASTMTQFRLEGSKVPHIADLLAAGAGKAQGSVHDLSMALNQGGLVASQMGLSVEDTVGTLTAFASAGLLGSDAGTSFKQALLMLANPTDKAAALMDELGINTYDAQGNFVGMTSLAGQLKTQLGSLTMEQRNAALATIFGADAIRAASILYEEGADGVQGWIDAVNDTGYAAETARLKTDNLKGDIERLTGELETLAIEAGSASNGGLRILVQAAEALTSQIGKLPSGLLGTGVAIAGVVGGALLLSAAFIKSRRATADVLAELRDMGPAGTRAARGLEVTTKWAGKAAAAFIAFEVAAAAVSAAGKDLNPQVEALGSGLEEWTRTGKVSGETARLLGDDMSKLETALYDVGESGAWVGFTRGAAGVIESMTGLGDVMDDSLTKSKDRINALDQALAGMVQAGNAEQARAVFDKVAESAAKQGVSVQELEAILPGYTAAVEVAGKQSGGAADGIEGVGDAAAGAAKNVEKLNEEFDKLFGAYMDMDRATLKYKQGIADLTKTLSSSNRTLSRNTEAGRDNTEAVLDQIDRIKDLRDARIAHGQSLDEANGKYVKDIEGLRRTLLQLGYNRDAVDQLIGKYKDVPDEVSTKVSAPGAPGAKKDIDDVTKSANRLPSRKETEVRMRGVYESQAAVDVLKRKIDALKNKKIYVQGTVQWTSEGDLRVPGGRILERRWGGVTEYQPAATGHLRQAELAGPGTRYQWAEPQTGGEAFIPRHGDLARSRAIWEYVGANWLGMGGGPGAGAAAAPAGDTVVYVTIDGQQLQGRIERVVVENNRATIRGLRAGAGARR